MPRTLSDDLLREVPILRSEQSVREAARILVEQDLPALPVAKEDGRYCGIFGEREFFMALFPGYLGELKYAGFVPHSLDDDIEKRSAQLADPVGKHCNSEHVDVDEDHSDAGLAETFLHHRVLIVPVVDSDRQIKGIVMRKDFFAALVGRLACQIE
jgi:CBS-domain-containing membrane protein